MPTELAINMVEIDDMMQELDAPDGDFLRVERLVNAASERLEKFCNTIFKARRFTKVLDGDGSPLIDLGGPIISVESVTADESLVSTTDYQVLSSRGQVYYPNTWLVGVSNIVVITTLGYDPLPYQAQEACICLVSHWHTVKGDPSLKSERIGEYAYERFGPGTTEVSADRDLPGFVKDLIMPFRRWSFA